MRKAMWMMVTGVLLFSLISPLWAAGRLQPEDLVYQGAFRLPDVAGDCDWTYSGHAMTFYPSGDPDGASDGYPGSLFASGNDANCQYISEISIPEPLISASQSLAELNTAQTLQPFADIRPGMFGSFEGMTLPRVGLAYLPAQGSQATEKLHFCWAEHFQEFGEASHGWCELDLSAPQSQGPWPIEGYSNYVSNDYMFEIPQDWSDANTPGEYLATGRAREGLWSGRGPALFAYGPWNDGNPPTGASVTPLLLYGTQEDGATDIVSDPSQAMTDYKDADHWFGGAWLSKGAHHSLIFAGTKALGDCWYGYANGVVYPHDCYAPDTPACPEPPEWPYNNRGFWADSYQAQIIFYDPEDLAAVASGKMESWEPQPYAVLNLDPYLYDPYTPEDFENHLIRYKGDYLGAVAFDRQNRLLYVTEKQADNEKSLIHVFAIAIQADIDNNGARDLADLIGALQILAGLPAPETMVMENADLDGDGKIGFKEVFFIFRSLI